MITTIRIILFCFVAAGCIYTLQQLWRRHKPYDISKIDRESLGKWR